MKNPRTRERTEELVDFYRKELRFWRRVEVFLAVGLVLLVVVFDLGVLLWLHLDLKFGAFSIVAYWPVKLAHRHYTHIWNTLSDLGKSVR